MAARTLLTFQEFERYEDDGMKHVLLEGEHIVVPPPKHRHSRIQLNLSDLIRPCVRQRQLGEVYIESGFKLGSRTWLQPDVSFVRTSQIEAVDPNGYLEGAPALAIDVISESNTAARIAAKIKEHFKFGDQEVWVVEPQDQSIHPHYPDGRTQTFASGELRSDLFPGWSLTVAQAFNSALPAK